MIEKILASIQENYPLEKAAPTPLNTFKAAGMRFETDHYNAAGLGSVSVMRAKGFFGLMRMDCLIVNPFDIDAPLFSCDMIHFYKSDSLIAELYNTLLEAPFDTTGIDVILEKYSGDGDQDPGHPWYENLWLVPPIHKKIKEGNEGDLSYLDMTARTFFEAYLAEVTKAPVCDRKKKQAKAAEYSDGLLKNGGPATNPVKRALGKEKAKDFFQKILFATEE